MRALEGSPNVVIVVLDDTGFGHLGCYGSPIATPNLDRRNGFLSEPLLQHGYSELGVAMARQ